MQVAAAPAPPDADPTRPLTPWLARGAIVCGSVVLFAVACALPALVFKRNGTQDEMWFGFQALLMGWLGPFVGQIAWYANLVLPIAWLCALFRWWIAASVFAVISLAIGLTTFMLYGGSIPADEANVNKLFFQYPHAGFYVWMLSMLVVLVGSVGCWIWEKTAARRG